MRARTLAAIIAAALAVPAVAGTETFRLERDTDTGAVCVVGVDGVRREVLLMSPDQFEKWTAKVSQLFEFANSTSAGRAQLHGKSVRHFVDKDAHEFVTEYEDGYRHAQKMVQATPARKEVPPTPKKAERPPVRNMSKRQAEMRERLRARAKEPPREVTIEHDANTGTDREVK